MMEALRGNLVEALTPEKLSVREHAWLLTENGRIVGVFDELPETYRGCPTRDYGQNLIVQSFADMHLHAPQYPMLGTGMDKPLIEWLNAYAFPTETRFQDPEYARQIYRMLARELVENGTTRVCMFSSIHREATLILMEELENVGITGYAGKVNMDRNGAPRLTETVEESLRETETWLAQAARFSKMKPVLTPRFTPACSDALMRGLGELSQKNGLPVQSHLSENPREIEWVRQLHPDCSRYWETYDKFGLFHNRTAMAHCVYSDPEERRAMLERGVLAVHCPDSNINICSGLAPVRTMLDEGVRVALGSDIAGGALLAMNDVMTAAIRMSKVRRIESGRRETFLSVSEAYYMATSASADWFGLHAGFAPGDPLHALVLDDSALPDSGRICISERFERLMYQMKKPQIRAVYGDGKLLVSKA